MPRIKYIAQPLTRKKVKRKGVHAKKKTQKSATSKNYRKRYRGQGR